MDNYNEDIKFQRFMFGVSMLVLVMGVGIISIFS